MALLSRRSFLTGAVARTAYDDGLGGAPNAHDANYLTFHRVANFRRLSMQDSVMRGDP